MAENQTVQLRGQSAEEIAYQLMKDVCSIENKQLYSHGDNPADRKWLLDTYAECLFAVRGRRSFVES